MAFSSGKTQSLGRGWPCWVAMAPHPGALVKSSPDPAVSPCGALSCHGVEGAEQGWQVRREDAGDPFSWDRTKVV